VSYLWALPLDDGGQIGHWICHARRDAGSEAPTYYPSQDVCQDTDRDLEREANVFGAELLMPETAVRAAGAALPDPSKVAARFGVSVLAAQWRLYSFGLAKRPA
jgi:Zn-dependent peptidase ImmA (M78 family)